MIADEHPPTNALSVSCPLCLAAAGEPCFAVQNGHIIHARNLGTGSVHRRRIAKATLDLRRGRYVITQSGRRVYLLNPDPESFVLQDIAHGLANICRFYGQTRAFFSVAEHCVMLSRMVNPEHRIEALLHDASEAYTGDLPQPVKAILGKAFDVIEDALMEQIARIFGFPYPLSKVVKDADAQLGVSEMFWITADNFYDPMMDTVTRLPLASSRLVGGPLTPNEAKSLFLRTYEAIQEGGI